MRSRVSLVVVLLWLVATALVAPRVDAASDRSYDDPRYSDNVSVVVEGTLIVAEVEQFGARPESAPAYAVRTDDGALVPVSLTSPLPANGRFRGELAVAGRVARELKAKGLMPSRGRAVDEDTAAGQTAFATAADEGAPMPVAQATVTEPAAAAAPTALAHKAYVAKMTDQASVDGDDATVGATVDRVLSYWTTESDGVISSFGRVGAIKPFDSTANIPKEQACGLNNPYAIWNQAEALFTGVNFNSSGNHLVVLVGEECGNAGPVGVATVGQSISSGGLSILSFDSSFDSTPSSSTVDSTGVHELGHNFGLQHANLDTCPTSSICEYFDLYSPMALSVGGGFFTPPALGTLYRSELGLTTASEVPAISLPAGESTQTTTQTMSARSSATGTRGLLVTDPTTGKTYSVDWRSHAGRDATTFYGAGYSFGAPHPRYGSGVVIERQATVNSTPDATFLMTHPAAGTTQGAYVAGESFSPTSGLTIAVNSIGTTASVSITLSRAVSGSTPTISGTARAGNTVTADPGAWTDGATLSYDWRLDGSSTGSTGTTYAIPADAAGKALTVRVTGTKSGLVSTTKESAASIVGADTVAPGSVAYTGTAAVGSTVTAASSGWPPGTVMTYQWFTASGPISGATSASYTIPASLFGASLHVKGTGTTPGYPPATVASGPRTVAAGDFVNARPRITGTLKVGRTLTLLRGTWTPAAETYTYRWYADGVAIYGATGKTYTLTRLRAGDRMSVRVTGSKTGYTTESRYSLLTARVAR